MFDNIDLNMMMKIFMIQRADDDNKFDDDDNKVNAEMRFVATVTTGSRVKFVPAV